MHYVYYLLDPREHQTPLAGDHAYVGVTINPRYRLRGHLKLTRADFYNTRWVQKLKSEGFQPTLSIRCIVEDEAEAFRLECLLIEALRSRGVIVTNTAEGGSGGNTGRHHSQERRAEIRAKIKASFTPERRAQISQDHAGHSRPEDVKARISQSVKASMTPELRKLKATFKGRQHTPETRRKQSEAARKRTPEQILRASEGHKGWSQRKKVKEE